MRLKFQTLEVTKLGCDGEWLFQICPDFSTSHFEKHEKKEKKVVTVEDEVANRVKQKYDKFC